MTVQRIALHADAPEKPDWGKACNGCGVCCAAETCPVGRLVFRHRGPCPALLWTETEGRYHCGLLIDPASYLSALPRFLLPWFRRWMVRAIAAGQGCDSDAIISE